MNSSVSLNSTWCKGRVRGSGLRTKQNLQHMLVWQVAAEEPRELTAEEEVEAEIAADEDLLNNPGEPSPLPQP